MAPYGVCPKRLGKRELMFPPLKDRQTLHSLILTKRTTCFPCSTVHIAPVAQDRVEYIKTGFKDKRSTGVIFLDIQKAFDRVWHVEMLYKLIRIKTSPHLTKIIRSYLSNRNFAVRVNNTYSNYKNVNSGVPQGSLLGPTLFNIFVNDILKSRPTTICLYADDITIMSQHTELNVISHFLHRHLVELEGWFSRWKIALNSPKTEAVFFSHHRNKKLQVVHVNNNPIPWSQNMKYLGVILDKNFTFHQHITQIKK
ncbi:RNA-directed DNA polymerase from mobile element jockey [Trichonephila clavipes]|nr:RNA-directed DNA polymerase from mobile element jockey [Trichonephila clavipes]